MSDQILNLASEMRPKKFSEMVGQKFAQGVGEQLGKGLVSGQGYIICGPKGCGKTTLARIIAKALNCDNRDPKTGDPCGECQSCAMTESRTNPMITEVNAASNRGINDIRDMLSNINVSIGKPDGYRVYILDEVHMLTPEAFSALLKTMEEPPQRVIFICTTTNKEKIPETILSRSPIIPILLLNNQAMRKVLLRTIEHAKKSSDQWDTITDEDIEYAIISADGSARQAITNLSGIIFHGIKGSRSISSVDKIVKAMVEGKYVNVLTESRKALDNDETEPVALINGIISKLLNILIENKSPNPAVTAYQITQLTNAAQDISVSTQNNLVAAKILSSVNPPK